MSGPKFPVSPRDFIRLELLLKRPKKVHFDAAIRKHDHYSSSNITQLPNNMFEKKHKSHNIHFGLDRPQLEL